MKTKIDPLEAERRRVMAKIWKRDDALRKKRNAPFVGIYRI